MSKSAKFNDSDQDLIDTIIEYQKKNNLSSFSATVRNLCAYALKVEQIRK